MCFDVVYSRPAASTHTCTHTYTQKSTWTVPADTERDDMDAETEFFLFPPCLFPILSGLYWEMYSAKFTNISFLIVLSQQEEVQDLCLMLPSSPQQRSLPTHGGDVLLLIIQNILNGVPKGNSATET